MEIVIIPKGSALGLAFAAATADEADKSTMGSALAKTANLPPLYCAFKSVGSPTVEDKVQCAVDTGS